MKEGKTTKTTAKKKTYNNTRNHTSRGVKEAPKVREVKAEEFEENFLEEDGDKRLIVFIAIAILVIVGTVIGLLVGCQKEKTPEPEKPNDDIVVPDNKKDDKKEESNNYDYDYEKPLPVVRKVTKKTKTTKETETTEEGEGETEPLTHMVTFIVNGTNEITSVEDGNPAEKYEPVGYTNCSYYSDEEMTSEYEFNAITENTNIYMVCELVEYTVVYDTEVEGNPTTYTVEDEIVALNPAQSDEGVFDGWYTAKENGDKVATLDKNIVNYANSENVINLYAVFTTNSDEVLADEETSGSETVVDREETTGPIESQGAADETGENEEGQDKVVDTTATENENDKVSGGASTDSSDTSEASEPASTDNGDEGTKVEDSSSVAGEQNENKEPAPADESQPAEPVTTDESTELNNVEDSTPAPANVEDSNPAPAVEEPVIDTPTPEEEKPVVEEPKTENTKPVVEEPKETEKPQEETPAPVEVTEVEETGE